MIRVRVSAGNGHENDEPYEVEFNSAAEAAAFIKGINTCAEAMHGWDQAWCAAKIIPETPLKAFTRAVSRDD